MPLRLRFPAPFTEGTALPPAPLDAALPPSLAQAAKAQGKLDVKQLLDLKDSGVDVAGILSDDVRQQLYRQEVGGWGGV